MTSADTRLAAVRDALAYQRQWFADLRRRAGDGEPFALVNADAPQELFRALGMPYVVNQWWASIITAKRRSADHLERLRNRGLPDTSEQYSALALASVLDTDGDDDPPWGGLPMPSIVVAETSGDTLRKVFDLWQSELGVPFYALESAAEDVVPYNWWDLMPDRWEQAIGPARIDLMEQELRGLARTLETMTGRPLRMSRLREVMRLSNEHAEWNRRTRDLLATTRPCPLPVNDVIPGVMIPQWHRGTEWARDAARRLYTEVRERVEASSASRPERTRLMWIGRGLWHDMALYRRFEESHGAVFVWSMYLALAADAYPRYGGDPLRAVAARFCAFHDQMYTPPWSSEWYVKEARAHGVDGVVHLISSDSHNAWATTHALRGAGLPVLELRVDNADPRAYDPAGTESRIAGWLDSIQSAPAT